MLLTEFTEVPQPSSISSGELAVFRCQNDAVRETDFITWLIEINGTQIRRPYPPGITNPSQGVLRIVGHPSLNGTSIQCVVFIFIGPRQTDVQTNRTSPVILTVYEGLFCIHDYYNKINIILSYFWANNLPLL